MAHVRDVGQGGITILMFTISKRNNGQLANLKRDRLALVTDPPNLVFGGSFAKEANGGVDFPVLYSPPTFMEGSSVSHLSENPVYGYPGDLMVPHATLGGYNHIQVQLDLAMLKDVGWISPEIPRVPEPCSLLLLRHWHGDARS